jgi:predicted transcriptional regulator of viral defense system
MAKLLNWITVEQKIRESGLVLFSPLDLQRTLKTSEISVRFLLTRYTKKGAIVKLRRRLYALSNNLPSDFEIANILYRPSYVSLTFALSYYHIIPETTYTITSVTTRRTYEFEVLGKTFSYHRLKKEAFTGYVPEKTEGKTVLIAEKEKAFVDYLYFVERKILAANERIDISSLSKEKVAKYADLFQRKSLNRLIENFYG